MSVPYRRDVDGLRAIAIIPVVLYHYGVAGFSGGYVGVDVFFVISGFLITSLIHGEIKAQEFSFLHFYERRIRRIFPALFALLFVTGALAFTEFFPSTFSNYAKSMVATGGFLSNVEFWRETDYFNAAADQRPLLHTWSLAVEEQFYLVFPPFMMLISRFLKGRYTAVFLLIFAGSLALSVQDASSAPYFAFYLLPARIWELLLGALIAVGTLTPAPNVIGDTALAALGAGMIAAAVVLFTSETPFPGAAALLPCLGAGFIIVAGRTSVTPVSRLLSWNPLVFIGKISYSLYLWHWPLYVFAKYRLARELTAPETTALIALSAIVAVLSWRYVEQPFRGRRGILTRPALFATAGTAMAVSMGFGTAVYISHGVPQRFSPQTLALLAPIADTSGKSCRGESEQTIAGPMCRIGSPVPERPTFLIWGDSHARALMPAVAKAAERFGYSGLSVDLSGCPPLAGVNRTDSPNLQCRRHNDLVLAYLRSAHIGTVILVSRWSINIEGVRYGGGRGRRIFLEEDDSRIRSVEENRRVFARAFARTVEALRSSGHRVIVVGPVPEIEFSVPETLARNLSRGKSEEFGPTLTAFETRNKFVLDYFRGHAHEAEFLYPHRLLCPEKRCAVERDGKPLYADDNHLSHFGAESLSVLFEPLFAGMRTMPIERK